MLEVMEGRASDIRIASFLTALRMKGETVDEITAAAEIMREKVIPIKNESSRLVDTCGTGGDGSNTFNISTASAILAAAAGAVVAKHGNRSVSSKCGSADVLQALGVHIDLSSWHMADILEKTGIAFLFAPLLHPAMKYVMPARKELGIRTIFNILGPLTNPAGSKRQVMGVYANELVEKMTETLKNLGSVRAFVVHSADGLDEVSTCNTTFVGEVVDGKTKYYTVSPEDFGIKRATTADLIGGTIEANKDIILDIVKGVRSPKLDIAVLNAGFALVAAGVATDVHDGVSRVRNALNSGHVLEKFESFVRETNSHG